MTSQYALTLDNKTIWKFFKEEHPSLNLETSVLLFIDIMNKLSQDVNTSLNNTLAQQLVDSMKQLQSQVTSVGENVTRMQNDTLKHKLYTTNKKFQKVLFYTNICIKKPSQVKFLKSWINRTIK
jgi:hypothetical protein